MAALATFLLPVTLALALAAGSPAARQNAPAPRAAPRSSGQASARGEPAQNRFAELRSQFTKEGDPARRAKALARLGEAQFKEIHREIDAVEYAEALKIAGEYRDEVRSMEAWLKSSGIDAERHPGGFKQLQIHLRKSLRELEQTILSLPDEQRDGFSAIRKDLLGVEKELIDLLFPRQPEKSREKEVPKG